MTPAYARAPKDQRAYARVPRNRGANTSFIALLSHTVLLLFLLPYSPDLNPIEEALSKIKTFVIANQARLRDAPIKPLLLP